MRIYQSDRGEKMIRFIESLKIPEGMHTGQSFTLRPFQKHILREVYNPIDEYGHRVVRKAIYSVGKKNGKTPLIAGVGLGHTCGPESKQNEQLYSAAFQKDQSGITYRYMRQMIEMDEELERELVVKASIKEIECPRNGAAFKALSSEKKGKHGIGPALLIFDELAQFGVDREFFDILVQGRGAHVEALLWIISTQAANDAALLSQEIDYGLKVMRGEVDDPTVKCFLYTTPIEISLMDEEAWKLSNPALGDFLSLADMQEAARTAVAMPSAEAGFRNLRLNQRVDAASPFIPQNTWKANGGEIDQDLFATAKVWGGLDLSGKNDLSALIYTAEDEGANWHVRPYFWTPGDSLRERGDRDKVPYQLWASQGHLEAVPGKVIDYAHVALAIQRHMAVMDIQGIKFDRWRIADLQRELQEIGVEAWIEGQDQPIPGGLKLIQHGQGFKDMSPAVEIVEDLLASERIRHGMHPVLTMCAANTRVQADPAGGRKFDKLKSTGRIDGIVAMSMALNGAATAKPEVSGPSIYEMEGVWE